MLTHKLLFVVAAIVFAIAFADMLSNGIDFPSGLIAFTAVLLAGTQAHMHRLASKEYFE